MRKIVVTGPESTGKSALSASLARYFNTLWVPEFAREYIDELARPYNKEDLYSIYLGQKKSEMEMAELVNHMLICDTDVQTIRIWSEFKYGECDARILLDSETTRPDLYLLCDIDLPWEDDPQREHPHLRRELMDAYIQLLEKLKVPYEIVSGTGGQRTENAIQCIIQNDILAL